MNRHQRRAKARAERFGPALIADADVAAARNLFALAQLRSEDRAASPADLLWAALALAVLADKLAQRRLSARSFALLLAKHVRDYCRRARLLPAIPLHTAATRPMTRDLYVAASVGPCWAQLRASVPGGVAMPP